jgi:hypothetical protein
MVRRGSPVRVRKRALCNHEGAEKAASLVVAKDTVNHLYEEGGQSSVGRVERLHGHAAF